MTTESTAFKPNFLIVGAPKAGTTSLYAWLKQHPDACMSRVKEPHYFLKKKGMTDWSEYLALFDGAAGKKAIGEASPSYLAMPESPAWIEEALGRDVRIIILLREPVARAFSSYSHRVMEGLESIPSFEAALQRERAMLDRAELAGERPIGYCQRGLYYEQVKRYLDRFGADRVRVYLFDDLTKNQAQTFADVCRFLGIDDTFRPRLDPSNVSRLPRSVALQCRLRQLRDASPLPPLRWVARAGMRLNVQMGHEKRKLSPETRAWLRDYFHDDIQKLATLIGRDLTAWTSRGARA